MALKPINWPTGPRERLRHGTPQRLLKRVVHARVKATLFIVFAGEGFDDALRRQRFFQHNASIAQTLLHAECPAANAAAQPRKTQHDQRGNEHDYQHQPPVDEDGNQDAAHQHHHLRDDGQHIAGQRGLQHGDIVSDAAHQFARAAAVEEAQW